MLLDANVLIALVVAEHEHHEAALAWCAEQPSYAVCPITEGALVMLLLRVGESAATAQAVLRAVHGTAGCRFLPDDLSYDRVDLGALVGHQQVTDAYLAALALHHGVLLATFDRGLARAHAEACVSVPQ